MKQENILVEKITQIVIKWNTTRSTRRVFGSYHLNVKQAFKVLFDIFSEVFSLIEDFSIVKKRRDLAILAGDWMVEGKSLQPMNIFESILSIKEDFERLGINSVTFCKGLTKEELMKFFDGVSASPMYLGSRGMEGFLETKSISNIRLDRFKIDYSREREGTIFSVDPEGKETPIKMRNLSRAVQP